MKWIKFLKEYDQHKVGEIVSLDDAEAGVLVKTGTAEETSEPEQVATKGGEITEAITAIVGQQVEAAMTKVLAELKPKASGNAGNRPNVGSISVGTDNEYADPKLGYKHFGEFAGEVTKFATRGIKTDRLEKVINITTKAPTNYASEAVGADGGFLIPPDFNATLLQHTLSDEALLPRCRQMTTSGNTITIPKDETVPWGTDGVQVYWQQEFNAITDSKPKFGEINMTLHKLAALVPVTNEMLDDSFLGLGQYLNQVVPPKIRDKQNAAILNGTGAGQPQGISTTAALLTQNKDSGQATATLSVNNIAGMLSLLPAYSQNSAVFLHHSTLLPAMLQLTIGNYPVFTLMQDGVTGKPRRALWGLPTIISEQCQPFSSKGDIFLIDFNQYIAVTKGTGIDTQMSIHLYFDRDMTAFRFVFRMAGQPWMQNPISQKNGTGKLSPFVVLQNR